MSLTPPMSGYSDVQAMGHRYQARIPQGVEILDTLPMGSGQCTSPKRQYLLVRRVILVCVVARWAAPSTRPGTGLDRALLLLKHVERLPGWPLSFGLMTVRTSSLCKEGSQVFSEESWAQGARRL